MLIRKPDASVHELLQRNFCIVKNKNLPPYLKVINQFLKWFYKFILPSVKVLIIVNFDIYFKPNVIVIFIHIFLIFNLSRFLLLFIDYLYFFVKTDQVICLLSYWIACFFSLYFRSFLHILNIRAY